MPNPDQDKVTAAEQEGRNAFERGIPSTQNPYPGASLDSDQWFRGWAAAARAEGAAMLRGCGL